MFVRKKGNNVTQVSCKRGVTHYKRFTILIVRVPLVRSLVDKPEIKKKDRKELCSNALY